MNHGTFPRIVFLSLLVVSTSFAADDKVDLSRRAPVPANEQIPLSDFFRPDLFEQPTINQAGTFVAGLVTTGEDRRKLLVIDLSNMKPQGFDPGSEKTINHVGWLNDSRLYFDIGFYRTFSVGVYAADVGGLSDYYPLLQYNGGMIIAVPQANRLRPLAWIPPNASDAGRDGQTAIINTDIRTGKVINMLSASSSSFDSEAAQEGNRKHMEDLSLGPTQGDDAGFLADRDGKLAFGFTSEDGKFTMYRKSDGGWEKAPVNLDDIDVIGFGRTRDELIVLGPRQEGKPRALQFLNAATGALGDVLVQDNAYDFYGSLYYQPGSEGILGARFERNGPVMAWFNQDYVALQKVLDNYFPGLIVRLIGSDVAGGKLLVETFSDRQPSSYFIVDLQKKAITPIEKSMPWIDPARMRPTSIVAYKTNDGQRLDAYVTIPAGASADHPVPLVVLPPGLPQTDRSNFKVDRARASWAFNREAQFWASRGYAVLQPNHRGSAGYGWEFPAGDEWEFIKMAEDIDAATRHLLHLKLIDPNRVAISGSYFSAYLAIAAAEADPDLFKAVVCLQGTYDWSKQLSTLNQASLREVNYGILKRHLSGDKPKAFSVDNRAGRIHAAVLVGYQREQGDATAQSTSLLSDLDHAGVTHESVPLGSERSPLTLAANQVEFYSRAEAFLASRLHPTPPPLGAAEK